MARVFKVPQGYEFVHLSTIGMRLVNEFQRQYPHLVKPSQDPDYRFVRLGTPEQAFQLEKLVANVLQRDPETEWRLRPLSKGRV